MPDNLPSPKPGETEYWWFCNSGGSPVVVEVSGPTKWMPAVHLPRTGAFVDQALGRWLYRVPSPAEIARGQRAVELLRILTRETRYTTEAEWNAAVDEAIELLKDQP